ncbi:MAG TPA: hypothetical protein VF629_15975 [Hymenobacter sp.]|jgi:hypothetical protein|uniref:hypothetical protein n=1 Tax=Hymenobacter sp. TaxID=1898978 RepID=UPI002ED888EF
MKLSLRTAPFDVKIDKLTRSIENAKTGESFPTEVRRLTLLQARKLVKKEWQFNWVAEAGDGDREVYQLNTVGNRSVVHGLISLELLPDVVFMHLLESTAFNKGRGKQYLGVAGNLIAYACRRAFELNHDGEVAFISKTNLINHYITALGATRLRHNRLYIGTENAAQLVKRYFPNYALA